MAERPRIGITMRLEMATHRFYLGRDYCEAVWAAGGLPVHIGLIPEAEYISGVLDGCDGVLLPGSNTDVDPQYYGEQPHPQLGTVIPEKDLTDRLVLDEVERRNLPLLGICFGMQALNVHRGGSLIQDIESQVDDCIKHEQGLPTDRLSHDLRIEEGSILSRLASQIGEGAAIRVNSSHHQAVKEVGKDLRAVAWTSDGVVECIEDTREDRFALGVQWHPELTVSKDIISREIFELFVGKCSKPAS
ncbi:MAG: gamma-glutamyl-gamma-aminobutyrate hydrolase family protein [Pyrinomonadaceae bacterium]